MMTHDPSLAAISLSAIVLAGGKSSRMGRDKALIELQGVPLLRRVCEVALECAAIVYVVTPRTKQYQAILPPNCQLIQEQPLPGETLPHGALLGFAQGLIHVQTDWVLLLACDLPQLQAAMFLKQIPGLATANATAVLPKSQHGWEPLCGFYRANCLPRLNAAIARGDRSFQSWLAQEQVVEMEVGDRAVLFNCNTFADLQHVMGNLAAIAPTLPTDT
jgi:molybdopterin-guanine dinucleotide biosynthesis protein A